VLIVLIAISKSDVSVASSGVVRYVLYVLPRTAPWIVGRFFSSDRKAFCIRPCYYHTRRNILVSMKPRPDVASRDPLCAVFVSTDKGGSRGRDQRLVRKKATQGREVGLVARGGRGDARWAHDPREARKVRRAANKAYQLPRRRGLLNGEEEWRTRVREEAAVRAPGLENS